MDFFEIIKEPWPWYLAGPAIAAVMALLLYLGYTFGISSTLRTLCAISGAGKFADFFRFDWKAQTWNLVFVAGTILGGVISSQFLMDSTKVDINPEVKTELKEYGISNPGDEYIPTEIFSFDNLFTSQGLIFIILGGFLVGFGTRYGGGCTSGHAITGLSSFQLPSLIAVIGFFIGGLIMTYLIIPNIL